MLLQNLRILNGALFRGINKSQGPYKIDFGMVGNMGYSKALKRYGYGGVVVGAVLSNTSRLKGSFRNMGFHTSNYSRFELPKGSSFKPSMKSPLIISKGNKGKVVFAQLDTSKLIHVICHPDVLLLAYELIKSKPGNMTRGVSSETLDGISKAWFQETSSKIQAGKYKFGLARRILIPKVGKFRKFGKFGGKRSLNMASPREKIVQKAMVMVLNEIYESNFLDYSHAFRPNRGCHSALQMVDQNFRGGKWVIKADLTECFDSISHSKLLAILSRRITCTKTIALIASSLKAGHVLMGKTIIDENKGSPQGSILSPLLLNIYLHELDLFMDNLIKENTLGKTRRKNPEYRSLQYQITKFKEQPDKQRLLRRQMWKIDSKDPFDPAFRRLAYVRYVDDFVIGIIGSRKMALNIMGLVERFLNEELRLKINREKTLLTKFSDGINFLGCDITNRKIKEKPIKLMSSGPAKGHLVRVSPRISFHAPIRNLLERLVARGYMKWSKSQSRIMPTAMRTLVNHDHKNILMLYNAVIRGLMNYYNFVDNRKSMGTIVHGLKMSCALTFALKYKLRTAAKVFAAYGRLLTCPKTKTEIFIPDTFARLNHASKFLGAKVDKTPEQIIKLSYSNRMTKTGSNLECIICHDKNVEMHHVRKLRELRNRLHLDWFSMQMAAINRKQVPLCSNHHHRLHLGILSTLERELFRKGCQELVKNNSHSKDMDQPKKD